MKLLKYYIAQLAAYCCSLPIAMRRSNNTISGGMKNPFSDSTIQANIALHNSTIHAPLSYSNQQYSIISNE